MEQTGYGAADADANYSEDGDVVVVGLQATTAAATTGVINFGPNCVCLSRGPTNMYGRAPDIIPSHHIKMRRNKHSSNPIASNYYPRLMPPLAPSASKHSSTANTSKKSRPSEASARSRARAQTHTHTHFHANKVVRVIERDSLQPSPQFDIKRPV